MFQVQTGTVDEWNEAFSRVEDSLRAHRIHSKLLQQRLIAVVLERAARRHQESNGAIAPVVLAAEEAERMMEEWFADILGPGVPPERLLAQGRVSVLLTDSAQQLPALFLEDVPTPPEVRERLRETSLKAGPDLSVSSMVPREIQLGALPEAAGGAWESLERFPIARLLLLWALFLGALTAIFLWTRA